jgi:hypothetical protein
MMIKKLLILIFSLYLLNADDIVDFQTRQGVLQDVKKIIQNEESIARAYEEYILNNYNIPSNISLLYTSDYLGTSAQFISSIASFDTKFIAFSISENQLSYALNNTLQTDLGIKQFYENEDFRKRTYVRNNKIYFKLEDSFAKHLFDLIIQSGEGLINPCSSSNAGKNCIYSNHIYIKPTYTSGEITDYLMSYHIDKFRTGPIIITNNTALHITSDEFKSIPKGALLYDTKGAKYVKTTLGIEVLK